MQSARALSPLEGEKSPMPNRLWLLRVPSSFRNLIPESMMLVCAMDSGIKFRNDARWV